MQEKKTFMGIVGITSAQIQFELKKRGITQEALAARLGVRGPVVSRVIHFKDRSARIEAELRRIVGWDPWADLPVTRKRTDGGTTEQR